MGGDAKQRPIGVFDSGLGGLTVAGEIARRLPGEDIVYLGDSARVPYGIKSLETVRRFALEDAAFLGRFEPKLVVMACNTASAAAYEALRQACAVEVIDVIRPGPSYSGQNGSLASTSSTLASPSGGISSYSSKTNGEEMVTVTVAESELST